MDPQLPTLRHAIPQAERKPGLGFQGSDHAAALSIPSNIAEDYERNSRKEYVQFLRVAKGSCGEVRTQLHIGIAAGLLDKDFAADLMQETVEIGRMLGVMIS
ncbi:MAG: four helix bundle protein, partial [Gammaproteobacteria bacterium]